MFWDSSAVVPVLVALPLAAAVVWADGSPAGEAFVCLDDRLRDAGREGFQVLPEVL